MTRPPQTRLAKPHARKRSRVAVNREPPTEAQFNIHHSSINIQHSGFPEENDRRPLRQRHVRTRDQDRRRLSSCRTPSPGGSRGHRRAGGSAGRRPLPSKRHRERPHPLDDLLGTARVREDDPGPDHRQDDSGSLRDVLGHVELHQGHQDSDGGGAEGPRRARVEDDRLHRRDPSL